MLLLVFSGTVFLNLEIFVFYFVLELRGIQGNGTDIVSKVSTFESCQTMSDRTPDV